MNMYQYGKSVVNSPHHTQHADKLSYKIINWKMDHDSGGKWFIHGNKHTGDPYAKSSLPLIKNLNVIWNRNSIA